MESKKYKTQIERVYQSFSEYPKTMKECDVDSGIMRASICRYTKTLRESNRLFKIEKRICSITKHEAYTYSTDSSLVPISNQTKLFPDEQ